MTTRLISALILSANFLVAIPALAGYNPPDNGGPSTSGGTGTRWTISETSSRVYHRGSGRKEGDY